MELILTGNILKCLISSANWNNNSNAGVWYLNWNNNRTNSNNNVGSRFDSGFPRSAEKRMEEPQGYIVRPWAKSLGLFLFGRPLAENQEEDMKRKGNLFEKIFSPENLYLAYLDARKGKRKKRTCFEFEKNLGGNLNSLYKRIHDGSYRPDPYFKFMVYEPKPRLIYGPSFRDIVVQHAIYREIYPIFNQTFISTSFACRKGYGTHRAADYAQMALRLCDSGKYTLKLDVRKFFYSIDRNILKTLIERKIKDRMLVDLMMAYNETDTDRGIPIGNLLSQLFASIYLNPLDHYIKRVLKIRHYVRYVDDLVLFGLTREECLQLRNLIGIFLRDELGLEFSKTTIQMVRKGINFCGYRTWSARRFIRKYSLYKFRKLMTVGNLEGIASLLGHARRTASLKHMLNKVHETAFALFQTLPLIYRRIYHARYQPN